MLESDQSFNIYKTRWEKHMYFDSCMGNVMHTRD